METIQELQRKVEWLENELKAKSQYLINYRKKFGRMFEKYAPFAKDFPGDPYNFIFIGKPIDGILFEQDKITFIEIKTENSWLTPNQKKVKQLVKQGKVEYKEVRYRE